MVLEEELARATAEARSGEKAGQIAQKLLHIDGVASLLIALDPEGVAWVLGDGMRKIERVTLLPGESTACFCPNKRHPPRCICELTV